MNMNKVKYHKKYLRDAAMMMSKTWHYDENLEGCKDIIYFYSLFLKFSNIDNKYSEFLTNDKDQLIAILMSTSTKPKMSFKLIGVLLSAIFGFLIGKLGKRVAVYKAICSKVKDSENLMKDKKLYDEEISLFFIDESCRGYGVGKKLMNNYMNYCKKNNVKNVILLTDAGCNFGFYEHYGFKRINEIHSKYFAHSEIDKNGYAYAYKNIKNE